MKVKGRTNISHGRCNANLDTRVSFLCQLALEELVQFGIEDTVCYELPTLGNRGSRYGSHDGDGFGSMEVDRGRCDVYRELLVGVTVVEDPRLDAKR